MEFKLFQKAKKTKKELAGAPEYSETIEAIKENRNWILFNTKVLNCDSVMTNTKLNIKVNAFKLCLQTYGPVSNLLPSFKPNKGDKVKGEVFHGHVSGSNSVTYVLEWAVLDPKERIITLIKFDKHENYQFRQNPLSDEEKNALLENVINQKRFERAIEALSKTKEKIERTEVNYRFCSGG